MSDQISNMHPAASPQQIRQELSRITKEENWDKEDWWAYFQAGQREIFESLYSRINEETWLKPSSMQWIEDEFVKQAQLRWTGPETKWILVGDWVHERPDIVKRLRANCFKNFSQKQIKKRSAEMRGSISNPPLHTRARPAVQPSPQPQGSTRVAPRLIAPAQPPPQLQTTSQLPIEQAIQTQSTTQSAQSPEPVASSIPQAEPRAEEGTSRKAWLDVVL